MLMNIVKILQKRPTDKTILIWRVVFWLVLVSVLAYNFFFDGASNNTINDTTFGFTLSSEAKLIFMYVITAFWLFPAIMWMTNICLMKKKYVRILQIIAWILLFYFSGLIKDVPNLDIDTLLFMVAFLPLFAWITWKCITTKCMKYWETIKKIRV